MQESIRRLAKRFLVRALANLKNRLETKSGSLKPNLAMALGIANHPFTQRTELFNGGLSCYNELRGMCRHHHQPHMFQIVGGVLT